MNGRILTMDHTTTTTIRQPSSMLPSHPQHQQLSFVGYTRQGVSLLQRGRYTEAIAVFRLAVTVLGMNLHNDDNSIATTCISATNLAPAPAGGSRTTTTPTEACSANNNIRPRQTATPVVTSNTTTSSKITDLMDSITTIPIPFFDESSYTSSPYNSFYCCARALTFEYDEDDTMLLTKSALVQNIISSVLMFNIGLTLHLYGLVTSKGSTRNLTQALGMYRMVSSLLERGPKESSFTLMDCRLYQMDSAVRMKSVFRLVLFTNMGHIFSHFFMGQEATQCRSLLLHLLDLACYTRTTGSAMGLHQILSDDERAILFLNGLVLATASETKAAAAA